MKTIIIILLLSAPCLANSIPGFLELDINAQHHTNVIDETTYLNTEIDFKYGVSHNWFQPYVLGNTRTYFQTSVYFDRNHPFRDVYTLGAGIRFFKVMYVEASHSCSHFVESNKGQYNLYKSFTRIKHNKIKIGLEIKID